MRAPPRLVRLSRQLFDCREPATAHWLGIQAGIRKESAAHLLRLLERRGDAQRCGTTKDGRALWRWHDHV